MIAVTGATGELGGRVAQRLAKLGIKQRLIVRDINRAPKLPNTELAVASSYQDAVAMGKALSGIDTLFIIPATDIFVITMLSAIQKLPVPSYNRVYQHIALVSAATALGVQRIVYVSFLNTSPNAIFVLSREHYHTEEFIRSTGIAYTFLRMSLYMDKVPLMVCDDGVIRAPAGQGRVSWVTRDDIADVAVAVLTGKGHDNKTYDVTGPEALTLAETAQCLSTVTGKNITYQAQTPHEARTLRNTSRMDKCEQERLFHTGTGLTEEEVESWISHYLQIAVGEVATVSDTVPKLTGHSAQTLYEYLNQHPESYQHLLDSS